MTAPSIAIMIAGERSGAGKTTVTLAMLAALSQTSQQVQSFKVGPDYIDPMFHRAITGRPSYNLDPVLTSETYLHQSFAHHTQAAEFVIVEGVMGLFDGVAGNSDLASSAQVARLLNLPVILVVDCARMSRSVAALVQGYRTFDPQVRVAGVVLNRVGSTRHEMLLREALATIHMPIVGLFHRDAEITLPDRHLGLVPTGELPNFFQIAQRLAHLGQTCFNWERLTQISQQAKIPQRATTDESAWMQGRKEQSRGGRIAIATDAAFNFYYPDNLELLETLGCELYPWSPLQDEPLPESVNGLYLGGGYPEMFAEQLATHHRAKASLSRAIQAGIPTYAECGGLMYLCEHLIDFAGQSWPMVGILPTTVTMTPKLTLGYRQAQALVDTPLVHPGQTVIGHEFHRSALTQPPKHPIYQSQRFSQSPFAASPFAASPEQPYPEGWQLNQLHASYLHLHWGAHPELAAQFAQQCLGYRE
jgi:cobyrinic acid a,c-diamide synthase